MPERDKLTDVFLEIVDKAPASEVLLREALGPNWAGKLAPLRDGGRVTPDVAIEVVATLWKWSERSQVAAEELLFALRRDYIGTDEWLGRISSPQFHTEGKLG